MTPVVIVQDGVEPITIEECRSHLEAQRYGDSDDDPIDAADDMMILGWLAAAREHCEDFLGLSLTPRVLEVALDAFPTERADRRTWIELPMGPVSEILSITTPPTATSDTDGYGTDGSDNGELLPDAYVLDTFASPARVWPAASWPSITRSKNAVRIRYVAGYDIDSDGRSMIPKTIRAAILLILGHLYSQREETTEKALASIPTGAEALMRPRRVRLGMA